MAIKDDSKLRAVYDAVSKDYELGTYDEFKTKMANEQTRRRVYDAVSVDYNLGSYDEFSEKISPAFIGQDAPQAAPAAVPAQAEATQQTATEPAVPTYTEGAVNEDLDAPELQRADEAAEGTPFDPASNETAEKMSEVNKIVAASKARMDASQQRVERMVKMQTPEGRKEAKAGEYLAKSVGLPTNVTGLVPGVPAEGSDGESTAEGTEKAVPSTQSPVVNGVGLRNGTLQTQWLLPDGSLTTSLFEAEQAEYGARQARLMAEFTRRMKDNGLDPAKQEDVATQAALDEKVPQKNPTGQVSMMAKEIDEAILAHEAAATGEYVDDAMSNPWLSAGMSLTGANNTDRAAMDAYRKKAGKTPEDMLAYETLKSAQRSLRTAQRIINEADHNAKSGTLGAWLESSFLGGAVRGMKQKLFDVSTWDFGATDISDGSALMSALNAADSGRALSKEQQLLLDAKALEMATNAYFGSYLGSGYKAGQVTAEAIPFMFEMAVNPLSALGNTATAKLTRYGLKRFGKKALKNHSKRYFASKVAARALGDVAGAAGMAATTGIGHVHAGTLERMNGDVEFGVNNEFTGHSGGVGLGEAIAKSFVSTGIENYSELLGGYFGPILSAIGKGVGSMGGKIAGTKAGQALGKAADWLSDVGDKVGLDKVKDFIGKVSASDGAKMIADIERQAQWHGVFGEYFEEVAGNMLNAALVGDMTFDTAENTGVFNADVNIDTFLGVALMGGFMSGAKTVCYRTPKYKARKALEAEDKACGKALGDKWAQLKTSLDKDEKLALLQAKNDRTLTDEQKIAIFKYAGALEHYNGVLRGEESARSEMAQDIANGTANGEDVVAWTLAASYNDGYEAEEGDREDLATRYGMLQTAFKQAHGGMSIEDFIGDKTAGERYAELQASGASEEELKLARVAFAAKEAHDGLTDRILDDSMADLADNQEMLAEQTNKDGVSIRKATLNNGQDVYIYEGNVELLPDGGGVDNNNSDESIIVYNPSTGKREMVSPKAIVSFDAPMDAAQAGQRIAKENEAARRQALNKLHGILTFTPGDEVVVFTKGGEQIAATLIEHKEDGKCTVQLEDGSQVEVMDYTLQDTADQLREQDYMSRHQPAQTEPQPEFAEQPAVETEEAAAEEQPTDLSAANFEQEGEILYIDENGDEVQGYLTGYRDPETGKLEYYKVGEKKLRYASEEKLRKMVKVFKPEAEKADEIEPEITENAEPGAETNPESEVSVENVQEDVPAAVEKNVLPIGESVFGKVYNQFKGKIKEAFDFLFNQRGGDLLGVFHRDEVGDIDLVWGDKAKNMGLEHIIDKHVGDGKDFESFGEMASCIEDVIKNGSLVKNDEYHYEFVNDGYIVSIRKSFDGVKKNWVVTSFKLQDPSSKKPLSDTALSSPGINEADRTVVGDNVSDGKVNNSSGVKQELGEESLPTTEPMPIDREGEPQFMQVTPERGHAYIFKEWGVDRDKGKQFVKNNIDAAKANFDKLKKKEPAIGTSIAKYNAQMAEWQQKLAEAQQALDYWSTVNDVQQRIEEAEAAEHEKLYGPIRAEEADYKQALAKAANEVDTSRQPRTPEEYVAAALSGLNGKGQNGLLYESLQKELGKSVANEVRKKLPVGSVKRKGNGGMTIEGFSEWLLANMPDDIRAGLVDAEDVYYVRNMVIDALRNGEFGSWYKERLLAEKEKAQRQVKDVYDEEAYVNRGFDTFEEYLDYSYMRADELVEMAGNFDEASYNDYIGRWYDEIVEREGLHDTNNNINLAAQKEDINNEQDTGQGDDAPGEGPSDGRSGEVLHGAQSAAAGGRGESSEGNAGGEASRGSDVAGTDGAVPEAASGGLPDKSRRTDNEGENAVLGRARGREIQSADGRGDTGHHGERQGDLHASEAERVNTSDNEFDEDGSPLVYSSNGSTTFGEIKPDSGLEPAPIKLSLGNSKYGLIHLEKRHGGQIRNAGFSSVVEFVEYVAKNYTQIKIGENSLGEGNGTYLLQIEDKHNNTLYIELSTDGSYWGVNSGGVFRKGYGSNKKEVWSTSEAQNKQSATDNTLRIEDNTDIPSVPNGNVSNTSGDKDSNSLSDKQEEGENSSDKAAARARYEARVAELLTEETKQYEESLQGLKKCQEEFDGVMLDWHRKQLGLPEGASKEDILAKFKQQTAPEQVAMTAKWRKTKAYKDGEAKLAEAKGKVFSKPNERDIRIEVSHDEFTDYDFYGKDNGGNVATIEKHQDLGVDKPTDEQQQLGRAVTELVSDAVGDVVTDVAEGERVLAEIGMPVQRQAYINEVSKKFDYELQQQIDGKLPDGHIYQLGTPGAILLSTGVPNLPIELNSARLMFKATNAEHDYDLAEVKGLVDAMQKPIAVFAYGDKSKAQNIVLEITHNGKNFVVGLSITPTVKGQKLEVNSIRTVFPKDNAEWLNWISQGKALYLDKEKIQALMTQQRINFADVDYLNLDSVAKVIKDFENPKITMPIIEQMTAWHGSPHAFDSFDHSNMGKGEGAQVHGWGTYVAFESETGKGYAKTLGRSYGVRYVGKETDVYKRAALVDMASAMERGMTFEEAKESHMKLYRNPFEPTHKWKREAIEKSRPEDFQTNRNLYEIEIPEDNGKNYLREDKELSAEQLSMLGEACEGNEELREFAERLQPGVWGGWVYDVLSGPVLKSAEAASKFLSKAGFVGMRYDGRRDGPCAVIFNEDDLQIKNRTQFFKTSAGDVYGFVKDGKIYLDPRLMNPNTPIHEYTHIWDKALMAANPELWARGKELMKQLPLWDEVKNDPAYADIAGDEDLLASEVHSRLAGTDGAKYLDDMVSAAKAKGDYVNMAETVTLKERIKAWLKEALAWVQDAFAGKWGAKDLASLTVEEFAAMPIRDLTRGVNPKEELAKATGRINNERELVAVHNLTEKNLAQAMEMGGFPLPSIAITKGSIGHTNFGEISLVFGKETIDPSNRKNKVYSSDAWTPTFPTVGIKLSDKVCRSVSSRIEKALGKELVNELRIGAELYPANISERINRRGDIESYAYDMWMRLAYLREKGVHIEIPRVPVDYGDIAQETIEMAKEMGYSILDIVNYGAHAFFTEHPDFAKALHDADIRKDVEKYDSPKLRERILARRESREPNFAEFNNFIYKALRMERDLAEGGLKSRIDESALRKMVDEKVDPTDSGLNQWLAEVFDGIIEKRGLRNDKDAYTPSGNRRSWEQLHDDFTLENVVKAMLKSNSRGGQGFFGRSFLGASAREYGSIDEIRQKAKTNMRQVDPQYYQENAKELDERFKEIVSDVTDRDESMSFSRKVDAFADFVDVLGKHHNADAIYKALHKDFPTLTMDDTKALEAAIKDVQEAATRFFEAKPGRAVGFDEVRLAVVPKDMNPAIVEALKARGIEVRTYERGNEQQRIEVVDNATKEIDIQFQIVGEHGAGRLDEADRAAGRNEAARRMDDLAVAREMEAEYAKKAERIEKLRNSKSVEITGNEIELTGDSTRDKKIALEYGKTLQGWYTNKDTGEAIQLQRGRKNGGVNEVLQHNYKDAEHLKSVAAIPQIIEESIYISSEPNHDLGKNPDVAEYQHYVCGLRIGEEDYTVHSMIAVDKQGNRYYDHNLTHIEKGKLLDQIENGQAVEIDGFGTTPGTKPTTITERKVRNLISLLQINNKENALKIKRATGWERGADGKWRYELPDGRLAKGVQEDYGEGRTSWTLGEFWNDEALFEAYPEMRNYSVELDKDGTLGIGVDGAFDSETNTIVLSDGILKHGNTSAIVHEIQHAIQEIESFAKGGNPGTKQIIYENKLNKYYEAEEEYAKLLKPYAEYLDKIDAGVYPESDREWVEGLIDANEALTAAREKMERLQAEAEAFETRSSKSVYSRLAGEVEARNAHRRIDLSDEERRSKLLEETEDVAREDQIFLRESLGAQHMAKVRKPQYNGPSLFDFYEEEKTEEAENVMAERLAKLSETEKGELRDELVNQHRDVMLTLEESGRTGDDMQQALRGLDDLWQQMTAMYGETPNNEDAAKALSSIEADVRRVRLDLLADARQEISDRGETGKDAYVTATGDAIAYKSMSENDPMLEAQGDKLKAEDGEFCHAERVMRKLDKDTGAFGITGMPEIKSAQDVAYLTRFLETASNEHVFVVFVKDGKGVVLHAGYGNDVSSTVDLKALKAGCDRLQPDEIYLVHNHPSGNMRPSSQDEVLIKNASKIAGTQVKGIIMDTWRRTFAEFGAGDAKVSVRDMSLDGDVVIPEYSMNGPDSMVFNKSHEDKVMQIMSADDAAKFIYKWRLGSNGKVGYFVQNRNGETTANISTGEIDLTPDNAEKVCEEAVKNAVVFNGSSIIFYGTMPNGVSHGVWDKMQKKISGYGLRLNDVIQVDGRASMHRSYNEYGEIPANVSEPDFRLGDPVETFEARRDEAVANHGTVMPDLAEKEVKVVEIRERMPFDSKKKTKDLKDEVVSYAYEHEIIGTMTDDETNGKGEISISKASIDKMVDDSASANSVEKDIHLSVIPHLREIIKESELVETHPDYKKGIDNKRSIENGYNPYVLMHRCYGAISVDGEVMRVKITLKEDGGHKNEPSKAYTYEVTKIELLGSTDGEGMPSTSYTSNPNGVGSVATSKDGHYPLAKLLKDVEKSYDKGKKLLDESTKADLKSDSILSTVHAKRTTAQSMSEGLHTPVTILETEEDVRNSRLYQEADEETRKGMLRNPGWFDNRTGEVVVNLSQNKDAQDVVATMLHETVAHRGLWEIAGGTPAMEQAFYDEIYEHLKSKERERVNEKMNSAGYDRAKATKEYMGDLAEKGFEDFDEVDRGIWEKFKAKVLEWLDKMLAKAGVKLPKWVKLGDNELRYMLWKSKQNLEGQTEGDYIRKAEDIAMRTELRVGSKYSNENIEEVNARFNEQLENLNSGKERNGELKLGRPGAILRSAGIDGEGIYLQWNVLQKKMSQEYAHEHPFTIEDVKNLPIEINRPIAVFESKGHGDFNILVNLEKDGRNFVVSLKARKKAIKGGEIIVEDIVTLYPKEVKGIVNWINTGLGKVYDKKRALEWLRTCETHNRHSAIEELEDAAKVVKNFDNPKPGGISFRSTMGHPGYGQARDEYEKKVRRPNKSGTVGTFENMLGRLNEAYLNSMRSLKILQEAVVKETGKPITSDEDAYSAENAMSSSYKTRCEAYERDYFKPLEEAINSLMKRARASYEDVKQYVIAKHGLERNEYMARAQADEQYAAYQKKHPTGTKTWDDFYAKAREEDYSGLTGLTGETDTAAAEAAAQALCDKMESAASAETTELWKRINAVGCYLNPHYRAQLRA